MESTENITLFKKAMWWNETKNIPHDCLIEGNKNTAINLGYFDEKYNLTEYGKCALKMWKSRNKNK